VKQLEITFDKNDELEKKINQLQGERLNFRAKQHQADQSMSRQDTQFVMSLHRANHMSVF